MQQNLFDIIKCTICLEHFKLGTHEPYVLICGHTLCMKTITKLYVNDSIKCPTCKEINKYESINKI